MLELSREEALQLVQYLMSELANPSRNTINMPGLVKEPVKPVVVEQVSDQDPEENPHRISLRAKLKSIGSERFDAMTEDEYGDWIDSLTFEEFLELHKLCSDREKAA
jgi:hypothetical protein